MTFDSIQHDGMDVCALRMLSSCCCYSSCCCMLLRILQTLIARLKARCLAMDCSAGMRVKKAGKCWLIKAEVLTVLSRCVRDAAFV